MRLALGERALRMFDRGNVTGDLGDADKPALRRRGAATGSRNIDHPAALVPPPCFKVFDFLAILDPAREAVVLVLRLRQQKNGIGWPIISPGG